jgi:hypothetical protein
MTRYYDELAVYERNGFDIIVDKSYEDLDPKDCFDDSCFDLKDMYSDIECGNLDWFMLRVRVMVENIELSSQFLGGCLYKDAREVLSDGTAEDQIYLAIEEAKRAVWPLMRRLQGINETMEQEAVCG